MIRPHDPWLRLAADTATLMAEASSVMWLRSLRLMQGGALAEREARRMVSEKLVAGMMLPFALAGAASPEAAADRTLRHYGKKVRANRRRLSALSPPRARARRPASR